MLSIAWFAAGTWVCQVLPTLPSLPWLMLGTVCAGLACVACRGRWRTLAMFVLAFLLGLTHAVWRAELRLSDRLDAALEDRSLVVSGYVSGLVRASGADQRFDFVADPQAGVPHRIALAWYGPGRFGDMVEAPPKVRSGERWQFTVRLRRPHGNANPAGFDYEGWLFQRGIRATGYVVADAGSARRISDEPGLRPAIDRWRERLKARIFTTLGDTPEAGVLAALTVGDQGAVAREDWQVFARTGTTHLMAISGLHVSMVAVIASLIVQSGWRRWPSAALRLPAQKAGALAGLAGAAIYVVLAGFGVPAQRTLYMLAIVVVAAFFGRARDTVRCLMFALAGVLLVDPWAVTTAGFWLSFGAVGALLLVSSGRFAAGGRIVSWLRTQGAVTIFSLPLLLGLFGQFSLVSPLANALAIPLVSMIIAPLALLHIVLPVAWIIEAAQVLLRGLMWVLGHMADSPFAVWQQAVPPVWLIVPALLAAAWACLPRGMPGRWAALLTIPVLLSWSPRRPEAGEVLMTAIDVGQGLAVHVQTATRDLLFDTGPAFGGASDSGERIVVPYLRAQGVQRIDGLIVSHGDQDHAGGAGSIMENMPVGWWTASLRADHPLQETSVRYIPCRRGLGWSWDGVHFDLLHPHESSSRSSNDDSCVLRVRGAHGTLLLPGDIEARAERDILAAFGDGLRADVLVAPHHGSRTSSRNDFVAAVSPQAVVFSVGHRNRFRHPSRAVVARYEASGAMLARTDEDGAVQVMLGADGLSLARWRNERRRYWYGQ
ncbi:DNA internalization-related competence protein ComEC/Rec2 [Uliginosibacterium sp. sgz301328]|uniref:DNA internalization-related competence protein ComEC/Rec2 n=1 Tax=Uliginosibacterium sp. sgz301328 TaxID=3243764 RepID=UPI00359CD49A